MIIDVHAHIWVKDHLADKYWEMQVLELADLVNRYLGGLNGRQITPDEAWEEFYSEDSEVWDPDGSKTLKYMDEAGIDVTVLLPNDHELICGMGKVSIEEQNEQLADIARRHPDRFVFFYGIDPRRKDAAKRFESAIVNLNAKGLKIYPPNGYYMDDKVVYPLYDICQETNLPVLTHLGPEVDIFIDECGSPLRMKQALVDFPKLKIIGAHLANIWWRDLVSVGKEFPNVYADMSGHQIDTKENPPRSAHVFRKFLSEMGPDKLMWGTDNPFLEPVIPAKEWLQIIRSLPEVSKDTDKITEAEIDAILGDNAQKLLGL